MKLFKIVYLNALFLQAQAEQTLGAMNATFNDTKDLDATKTIKEVLNLKSKIEEIQDVQRKNEIEQNNRDIPINEEENKENLDINGDGEEESSPKYLFVSIYFYSSLLNLFFTFTKALICNGDRCCLTPC